MKIVYEILKAPRWNASSSINTCNHQKSREKNPHIPAHPKLQFSTHRTGKHHPVNWTSCFCQFPDGEFRWSPVLPVDPWTHPGTLSSTCQHTGAHGTHRADRGWWGLAGGVEFGRDQNSNFWDFRIKGKSQNWSLTLLCLEVGVWNILGERQLNRWEFHNKDMWVSFAVCICMYKSDFHSNSTVQICTQWMCFWKLLTPNPKGSKQLPM